MAKPVAEKNPQETLVPEGEYSVAFLRCEDGIAYGEARWFVHCQIIDEGQYQGLPLIRYYNKPRGKILPRTHHLWLDYTALFGRRPPKNLKPEQFLKGSAMRAQVITVRHTTRGKKREELPKALHHSKIEWFLKFDAGPNIPGNRPSLANPLSPLEQP
jgi:hypothetical protein